MPFEIIVAIILGILLDLAIGDPAGMPHLVRVIGGLVSRLERWMGAFLGRSVFAGALLWLAVVASCLAAYFLLASVLSALSPWLKLVFDALVVFQCLAFRDLVKHVMAVKFALRQGIATARRRVSLIVGRDTAQMDEQDVCRAAIESGAENLNDAVIAPLFWAALFGPVGALFYRACNTMDAMIGHRTARYEKLGKVAARMDDALNFFPARLCAALILPFEQSARWRLLKADAVKHPSVNAGWPEAAMAKRLGVVIGGRMYERGVLVQTAQMNEGARQPDAQDIERSTRIMAQAYAKAVALVAVSWLLAALAL